MVTVFRQQKGRKHRPLMRGARSGDMLPRKNVLDFNPVSAIPRDFEFFGQDISQVSRLRFDKFTFIF